MKNLILLFVLSVCILFNAQDYVVVIDASHGGFDVGASKNAITESQEVLEFTQMLSEELNRYKDHIQVVQTRNSDNDISFDERLSIINNAQADLLISIHRNNDKKRDTKGVEIYIPENHDQEMSQYVADQLMQTITQYGFENKGVKTANFKLLKDSQSPTVLIELGYMSNDEDNELFQEKKQFLVQSIAKYCLLFKSKLDN